MIVIKQKWIKREDLRANPNIIYLFGDNLIERGMGGQAKEMRGEPNAIGIPTKSFPGNEPNAYFNDKDFLSNCMFINNAFDNLKKYIKVNYTFIDKLLKKVVIVIPADGLGTGLADLPNKAPRTYAYLCEKLEQLKDF